MRSEQTAPVIPDGYEVHYRLAHHEMVPFVQQQLRSISNPFTAGYWLVNIILLLGIGWLIAYRPVTVSVAISKSSLGIVIFFLLIPLHELIHGLAYKMCGAKTVSYHAAPRKLMFYALADRHVIGYRKFMVVAFSPFVIITSVLCVFIFTLGGSWPWTVWTGLLMHTSGCAGDFALAAYFFDQRKRLPLTYDLKDEGITIFLRRTGKSMRM
jgi:hypothetical protein